MTEEACPFCSIARDENRGYVIYESDAVIGFLDENPAVRGHTLVVPKPHAVDIVTGPVDTEAVFHAVENIGSAMERVLDIQGFSMLYTSGQLVGQIDHAHVHLLPRRKGDGISLGLPRLGFDEEWAAGFAEGVRDILG